MLRLDNNNLTPIDRVEWGSCSCGFSFVSGHLLMQSWTSTIQLFVIYIRVWPKNRDDDAVEGPRKEMFCLVSQSHNNSWDQ